MGISFNSLKMVCKGFKKVPLKDTKGILNKTNNFKWVKESGDTVETVLASGTKIIKNWRGKTTIKPDGSFVRFTYLDEWSRDKFAPFRIIKGIFDGSIFAKDVSTLKYRSIEEASKLRADAKAKALIKKREAFIKKFNEKYTRTTIKSEDGNNITKLIHDKKTGKLVHWFRKDKKSGNTSIGDIAYNLLGKEVIVNTPNNGNTIIKGITEFLGAKDYAKVTLDKANNVITRITNKNYNPKKL